MHFRLISVALLLALLTAGCSPVATQPAASTQEAGEESYFIDHEPLKAPATPRNGVRITEENLPAELVGWKSLTPDLPGGVSAVVGDALFVMASPGRIGDDAYTLRISDVQVVDRHLQVEAYLTRRKASGTQGRFYPRDYAKVPYTGDRSELPVDLKIIYDDAAFAYVKVGEYDHVDRQLLPAALRDWQAASGTEAEEAKVAAVGDFLYLMVDPGEPLRKTWLRFADVQLKGSDLHVTVTYEQMGESHPDWPPYTAPIFARIPFRGANLPSVTVQYQEKRPPQ